MIRIGAFLALAQFALVTSVFMLTGILPDLARDLDVSLAQAAQVMALFSLTYAVSAPFTVVVLESYDRKRVLIAALILFAACNAVVVAIDDYEWLLLARIVAATADGVYAPTATAVAASLVAPEQRGRMLSLVSSGVTLAFVAGVPLGTIIGQTWGWRATFVMVAALALIAAAGVWRVLPPVPAWRSEGVSARLAVLVTPKVMPTLIAVTASYTGLFCVYTYATPLLAEVAAVPASSMSTMLLAFGVATVVGNAIAGFATDRWGASPIAALALALAIPLLASIPILATSTMTAALTLFLWGVVHYACLTPLQHRLLGFAGKNAGVAMALFVSAIYLGVAAGAWAGGVAMQWLPLAALGWIGAGFKALALALFLWTLRAPRGRGAA